MGLDEKALEAVRQWTFTRAYRDWCRPVATQLTAEVEFSLQPPGNAPETSAWPGGPSAVAVDAAGNLFIAASTRVLRMDAKTGVLSTVAGSGTIGYGGDNGPASSAKLGPLGGIAVDRAGNLYIADWSNNRVRKVSHGVITTVAGTGVGGYNGDGPAIACQLKLPHGVAVDAAGNIYIADYGNALVREVSGGVMTTVAGTGRLGFGGDNGPATRAALLHPFGVAVDSSGNLYIADADERRIRKVSHGGITTVAGDGAASYNPDAPLQLARALFHLSLWRSRHGRSHGNDEWLAQAIAAFSRGQPPIPNLDEH